MEWGFGLGQAIADAGEYQAELIRLEHPQFSYGSHVRIRGHALYHERTRLQERDADWNLELGAAKAGRMRNNSDQRAICIRESYADYQGRTDFLRHPEIKKPGVGVIRGRPATDRRRQRSPNRLGGRSQTAPPSARTPR